MFFFILAMNTFTNEVSSVALKPKERTVKQIELDRNLRPIDKKFEGKGKAEVAKASKKK